MVRKILRAAWIFAICAISPQKHAFFSFFSAEQLPEPRGHTRLGFLRKVYLRAPRTQPSRAVLRMSRTLDQHASPSEKAGQVTWKCGQKAKVLIILLRASGNANPVIFYPVPIAALTQERKSAARQQGLGLLGLLR